MAKQPPRATNTGKVKFRVFEFEMDGSDDSIQDTMKTLAAALTRGGHGAAPAVRRLKAEPAAALGNEHEEEAAAEEAEAADAEVEDVVPKAPAAPKKPKKIQTYDILDDVRFDQTDGRSRLLRRFQ